MEEPTKKSKEKVKEDKSIVVKNQEKEVKKEEIKEENKKKKELTDKEKREEKRLRKKAERKEKKKQRKEELKKKKTEDKLDPHERHLKEMFDKLPEKDKARYKRIGEELYGKVDFDTGKVKEEIDATATLLASIRSGLHPKELEEDEKRFLAASLGEYWYHEYGYTKEDVYGKEALVDPHEKL